MQLKLWEKLYMLCFLLTGKTKFFFSQSGVIIRGIDKIIIKPFNNLE